MATRAYVRIFRDGKWRNVEIDRLSNDELSTFAESQGLTRGWVWAKFLATWIRDHIDENATAPKRFQFIADGEVVLDTDDEDDVETFFRQGR